MVLFKSEIQLLENEINSYGSLSNQLDRDNSAMKPYRIAATVWPEQIDQRLKNIIRKETRTHTGNRTWKR